MSSLVQSPLAYELVVREYRPANEWSVEEVADALQECIFMQDIHGAEGLYGRLRQEFQVIYEHNFGTQSQEPQDSQVAVNCQKAIEAITAIREMRQH